MSGARAQTQDWPTQGDLTICSQQLDAAADQGRNRLRTDTLAASVVILMAVTVVQRSVGFGRGILFCRWMSPEALGQWEMAYSFLLLAAPLAVLGVPGSFGRYAEHFRQRGHLRTFLRRAALWTIVCSLLALAGILFWSAAISKLMFGSTDYQSLVAGVALALGAVIFHHTLTALLVSMRLYRVVSAMNLAQSALFAATSLTLLACFPGVTSILIGYGSACFAASAGALIWSWPGLRSLDVPSDPLPHGQFWPKLLRFAFFVWLTNVLTNLIAIIDRYMIVHYSGMTPVEALEQVGNYHSSRIVPLLLVSFADLLSGLVMPHLSHDWEAGRRRKVGARLSLTIKITSIGMLGVGLCILMFAPFLFGVILQGRYDNGLVVLPWTLVACVWYGIFSLAQNYLWCAERTRLVISPLIFGLIVNVVLNLALLPVWGLYGAVVATAASACICLLVTLGFNRWQGMQVDAGCWLAVCAPVALGFGTDSSGATLACLVVASLGTKMIFNVDERRQLRRLAITKVGRQLPRFRRQVVPSAATGSAT